MGLQEVAVLEEVAAAAAQEDGSVELTTLEGRSVEVVDEMALRGR